MSSPSLTRAIEKANEMLEDMTTEEVYQYAFDRMVDELLYVLDKGKTNV